MEAVSGAMTAERSAPQIGEREREGPAGPPRTFIRAVRHARGEGAADFEAVRGLNARVAFRLRDSALYQRNRDFVEAVATASSFGEGLPHRPDTCALTGVPVDSENGVRLTLDAQEFCVCIAAGVLLKKLVCYAQFCRYAVARGDMDEETLWRMFLFCETQVEQL